MQKKFLTNLGLLMFLNLLVKPFWVLGIDRAVQNTVGVEEYGLYFPLLNFGFLFNIVLDMGITNFNNRNIAQNNQLLNKHFSSILILKMLLGLVYVLVIGVVALNAGYDPRQLQMLAWIVLNQFLLSFIFYLRSNISGLLHFKTDSLLSVLDRLLMILFCSILLWGNVTHQPFKIEWFVYAQTAAYLIATAVAISVVIRKSSFKRLNWNWPFLVMILKKSFPFALLIFLMAQYNRIDSVFIERILPGTKGKVQAGIYAQAFRLLDAAIMIGFLFSVLLLPLYSKMLKLKENIEHLTKLSFSLLFIISYSAAIVSTFYSLEMMTWLYPVHPDESLIEYNLRIGQSAEIFTILMYGFVGIATTYVFGTLLTANGSLKQLNIVAGSGVIISIVINLTLIPRMEALGAAYASLSAQSLTAVAQLIIAVRVLKFRINYKYIVVLIIFIGGLFAAGYGSVLLPFDWRINIILLLGASLLMAILLRILNLKEFIRIIRTEKA